MAIKVRKNFMDKASRKGSSSLPMVHKGKKSAKLTKDGLIFKNDLLSSDMTSQTPSKRSLKKR